MKVIRIVTLTLLFQFCTAAQAEFSAQSWREEMTAQIAALSSKEDFAALEKLHSDIVTERRRGNDGLSALEHYYTAMTNSKFVEREKARAIAVRWAAVFPESAVPLTIEAELLDGDAWDARGNGYVGGLSNSALEKFGEIIAKAKAVAERAAAMKNSDVYIEQVKLKFAHYLGGSREETDAILESAARRDPTYLDIYLAHARFLVPKWGAKRGELEAFTEEAVRRTSATEGKSMYARLPYTVGIRSKGDLKNYDFQWEQIREGYEDLIRLYPGAGRYLTYYFKMAVQMDDRETAQKLLAKMGKSWDESKEITFGRQSTFDQFVSWTENTTPRKVYPIEALRPLIESGDKAGILKVIAENKDQREFNFGDDLAMAVSFAVLKRQDMVPFLLEQGADPNYNPRGLPAISQAVVRGDLETLRVLLTKGDLVRAERVGDPLTLAIDSNYLSIVEELMKHPTMEDATLQKGLEFAVKNDRRDVVALMLRSPKVKVDGNGSGTAPLHIAAAAGNSEMVQLLLEHKADCTNEVRSKSPAKVAKEAGFQQLADTLQKCFDTKKPPQVFTPEQEASFAKFDQMALRRWWNWSCNYHPNVANPKRVSGEHCKRAW